MIVLYSTTNHTIVTAFSTIFKHGTPLGRLSVLPRYPGASSSTVTSEALMELAATLQPGTHGVPSGNFNALRLNMAIEIVDLPYEKLWKMVIFHSYVSLDIHRCGKLMGKPMGKMIYLFKGCRPCRRPRKNRQGSQANWHKNSSVLRTLRLSTFFLWILLWNIFDRFEFSFVNGFFMIYWLSWSRRSLCMSIQVRAMWSGGVAVWVAVFDLGWTYNKWHYHKGIFTLWSWTKLHCVARGCLARNCWFVLMVFSFHFFLGWCVWPPLRES